MWEYAIVYSYFILRRPMKQFTYKEFDTITGIVFTNLCCDMLNRFDIDMFNDPKARPIFKDLADYVRSNVKILEEE